MRPLRALLKGSLSFGGSGGFDQGPFWNRPDLLYSPLLGDKESIAESFEGYVQAAYKANGVVFACIGARARVFSEARFQYQEMNDGRPGRLTSGAGLDLLETPWPNGTTGELLFRMEQDTSLAGNFYATIAGNGARLRRLRPDWVTILTGSPSDDPFDIEAEVIGYIYQPRGGRHSDPVLLSTDRVVHWSPIPDPEAQWRGMSWITPVVREIQADTAATKHKLKFFENGTTSNFVVSYEAGLTKTQFLEYVAAFKEAHSGVDNAYKTIHLGGGADVTTVGADMKQLDFKATQGAGEPLAIDTPVPTPAGWTTMGALVAGDQVFGRDGLPATVLQTHDVHYGRECFRVTFNDRSSIVADAGHLWTVMDRNTNRRAAGEYTTAEIRSLIGEWAGRGIGANRFAIAPAAPVKLPDIDLLVDPYVLGVWLGDGQTAGAAICGADDDLAFIASEIEARGYTVTRWAPQPNKVATIGVPGGLLAALRSLGVLGDKRIPAEYMRASLTQRIDLLRGLMDTDGTVGHVGKESCEFSSKHETLARQVAEVVRSLGYRATVSCKLDERSRTGQTWRVQFRADPEMVPFLLPRKVQRCVTPLHVRNRAVVSVEPVESVPVRCITVDTDDHLFLAGDGWVPTHNTRIAAASGAGAVVAMLSEGMQGSSLNAGNYNSAKRQFADMTIRPLWRSAAAALSKFTSPPSSTRLWYDADGVSFLQEDAKDAAEVQNKRAQTIRTLWDGGADPTSVIAAVESSDFTLLKHTGKLSVQLQDPNAAGVDESGDLTPRELAEMVQKIYLGVGKVLTAEEARSILNRAGAGLTGPAPTPPTD